MASLFGDDLDRKSLWSRIGSAIETACAKVSDDDLDRFVTLCLEHVAADPSATAACPPLLQVLETFAQRPPEWRFAFLAWFRSHRYAAIVHGRARWEGVKAKEIDL
ncbi:MAG: hypothetical protein AB7G11_02425 [Phycisphaerales bacterium]